MVCVLPGYRTALVGSQLFHDNLSIPLTSVKRNKSSWTVWPLSSLTVWTLKMELLNSPETSVSNYQHFCVISHERELIHTAAEDWKIKQIFCILCEIRCAPLGAFAKLPKSTINFVMSICPSILLCVHMGHLGSHWADFHEGRYLWVFQKSLENTKIPLNSDKN